MHTAQVHWRVPAKVAQRAWVNRDLALVALALVLENVVAATAMMVAVGAVAMVAAVAVAMMVAIATVVVMAAPVGPAVADHNRAKDYPYVAQGCCCYSPHSAFQKGVVASYYSYVDILFFTQWIAPLAFAYPLVNILLLLKILDCDAFVLSDEKKR